MCEGRRARWSVRARCRGHDGYSHGDEPLEKMARESFQPFPRIDTGLTAFQALLFLAEGLRGKIFESRNRLMAPPFDKYHDTDRQNQPPREANQEQRCCGEAGLQRASRTACEEFTHRTGQAIV